SKTSQAIPGAARMTSSGRAYRKGLALHLTNPKAILFFGALYSVGMPPGVSAADLLVVIAAVGLQGAMLFHGYALIFSSPRVVSGYVRLRRLCEAAFAAAFAFAGVKVLTARLS